MTLFLMLDFKQFENEMHEFWKKNKIFEKSVELRPKNKQYVFYDGPPFATGLPHYGHILGLTSKDLFPRFWTMKGYRVERRWGWDCHGLPVETIAEKELGIKEKKEIEDMKKGSKETDKRSAEHFKATQENKENIDRVASAVSANFNTVKNKIQEKISESQVKGLLSDVNSEFDKIRNEIARIKEQLEEIKELKKKLIVENCLVSSSAKEKIEKAKGEIK